MNLIPLGSFSNVSVCSYMVEGEGDDRRGGGGIRIGCVQGQCCRLLSTTEMLQAAVFY